jgi:hypothetical protein
MLRLPGAGDDLRWGARLSIAKTKAEMRVMAIVPLDTNVGTVTIRVQDAYVPGASGLTNVRYFEFQGDDRILLLPAEDGKGGLLPRRDEAILLEAEQFVLYPKVVKRAIELALAELQPSQAHSASDRGRLECEIRKVETEIPPGGPA